MNTKKIVVLADIESVRVPFTSFEKALKEVAKNGEIASVKFYGYSAKRTKDYADFIADNNYDALSSLAGKRKGKLDLRQVIDAVKISQYPNIDGIFIMYGSGNIKPLISYLRGLGIEVYAGVTSPDENSAKCDQTIILEGGALYPQQPKKAPAPKAARPVAPAPQPRPVAPQPQYAPRPAAPQPQYAPAPQPQYAPAPQQQYAPAPQPQYAPRPAPAAADAEDDVIAKLAALLGD